MATQTQYIVVQGYWYMCMYMCTHARYNITSHMGRLVPVTSCDTIMTSSLIHVQFPMGHIHVHELYIYMYNVHVHKSWLCLLWVLDNVHMLQSDNIYY